MGRPLRIEYPGALYHITSLGNERREIFLADEDRIIFLEILKEYHERFGILIHSYVLMDNHYHLILETPNGNLLKGRYKAILVDKDAYLLHLSRYVYLNPVRAKMVEMPEGYRWSSYPGYIRKGKEDIGKIFGGIHYSVVSKASARLKERMASDEKLLKLVKNISSHVKTLTC